MDCQAIQENLSAYLHGELSIGEVQLMHGHLATCGVCIREELELRKTQQALGQYHEFSLPLDFDVRLTKKIHRIRDKKSISIMHIISSAAAAILLTLGIQYMITTAEMRAMPAHYSLFQKASTAVIKGNSWADRMIDKFIERSEP
jgi:anti-sigma factor RsiW